MKEYFASVVWTKISDVEQWRIWLRLLGRYVHMLVLGPGKKDQIPGTSGPLLFHYSVFRT